MAELAGKFSMEFVKCQGISSKTRPYPTKYPHIHSFECTVGDCSSCLFRLRIQEAAILPQYVRDEMKGLHRKCMLQFESPF